MSCLHFFYIYLLVILVCKQFATFLHISTDSIVTIKLIPSAFIVSVSDLDHVAVVLDVVSSETNVDFVATEFSFFECSIHTS